MLVTGSQVGLVDHRGYSTLGGSIVPMIAYLQMSCYFGLEHMMRWTIGLELLDVHAYYICVDI